MTWWCGVPSASDLIAVHRAIVALEEGYAAGLDPIAAARRARDGVELAGLLPSLRTLVGNLSAGFPAGYRDAVLLWRHHGGLDSAHQRLAAVAWLEAALVELDREALHTHAA